MPERRVAKTQQIPLAASLLRETRNALLLNPPFIKAVGEDFNPELWNIPRRKPLLSFIHGLYRWTVAEYSDLSISKLHLVLSRKQLSEFFEGTALESADILLGYRSRDDKEYVGLWTHYKATYNGHSLNSESTFWTITAAEKIKNFISELKQ